MDERLHRITEVYYQDPGSNMMGCIMSGPASETVRVIVILEVGYIHLQCFSRAARRQHPCNPPNAMVCRDLHVAALQR
jgi:hypothetical protein